MKPSIGNPESEPQKLTTLAAALSERVSQARHDLRNPLAHILGFSEMAMEKAQELGLNHLKSRLAIIHRTAALMVEQINQSLDAAKLKAGSTDLLALQQQLRKASGKIISTVEPLKRKARKLAGDAFEDDLARIIGSAQRLLELIETSLTSLSGSAL